MKRNLVLGFIVVSLTGGFLARAAKAPPKVQLIKECQKTKPSVTYPHALHLKKVKASCQLCHHKGKPEQLCGSAGCHANQAEAKRPGCAEMSLSKNPFHITCIKCHKKEGKGPTACAQCHKK